MSTEPKEDALMAWLRRASMDEVGPHPEHAIDLFRTAFYAGWDAKQRANDSQGEQASLFHAEHDRETLRPLEDAFEATGPDLVEEVLALLRKAAADA